ncbi:MAG: T9SS type A sorting domain-containing protein [Bacteroidales bacterium]|nr:MAG: T9SS type A sorting domain-containing protein [Bacteroidales bacterium]
MRISGILSYSVLLIVLVQTIITAQTTEEYRWKSVQIRGGGFVTGIIYGTAEEGLLYARTDVGGAYRWNTSDSTWIPITDHLSKNESNYTGVLSIATDPSDPDRVYLATGLYTPWWGGTAAILVSTDRGDNWIQTNLSIKLGGNEDGRSAGERLSVDPNLGSILYLGSSKDGLWKSIDYGTSWDKVDAFPVSETPGGAGISFVLFDKSSGSEGNATQTIYAGILQTGNNLYKTEDGGTSWEPVSGGPSTLMPHHAAFELDSILYITFCDGPGPNGINSGEVWKYYTNGKQWTDITPPTGQGGFAGISADAQNPGTLLVSTMDRWWPGDEIYRSTDAGQTWKALLETSSWDYSTAPWAGYSNPHWIGDIDIDPFNPGNAWFITGYGLWAAHNVTDADQDNPVSWMFLNAGLEETVPLGIISPPSGAHLISVIGDIDGFRHDNLDESPATGRFVPHYGTNRSIDFAENKPGFMTRTHDNSGGRYGAYSTDGGTTWTAFGSAPSGANAAGNIAVSANGNTLVWCPGGSSVHYSSDNGLNWQASAGAGPNLKPVSDRVNALKFYIYDALNGRLLISMDRGESFTVNNSGLPGVPDWQSGDASIRTVYGKEGHIWLAVPGGLYRSVNSGADFEKISSVEDGGRVGFGRSLAGNSYPAIYLSGKVNGVTGFFRSDNEGESWIRINTDRQQFGWINVVAGDPRVYGRMYVATGGRGILYGEPLYDCNGDMNGTAYYDACDSCVGGSTGKEPCIVNAISDNKLNNVYCTPNPFITEMYIQAGAPFKYSVVNMSGLQFESDSCNGDCFIGKKLQSGVYILTISQNNVTKKIKIIKRQK